MHTALNLLERAASIILRLLSEVPPARQTYVDAARWATDTEAFVGVGIASEAVPEMLPHGDPWTRFFEAAAAANTGNEEAENNFLRMIGAAPDGTDVAKDDNLLRLWEAREDQLAGYAPSADVAGPQPAVTPEDDMRWADDGGPVRDDSDAAFIRDLRSLGFTVIVCDQNGNEISG